MALVGSVFEHEDRLLAFVLDMKNMLGPHALQPVITEWDEACSLRVCSRDNPQILVRPLLGLTGHGKLRIVRGNGAREVIHRGFATAQPIFG